jgi:O-acetylhomoserine/O-acetylserine sulfhydrylase-like pyridoxal-dependent enzyme
MHSYSWIDNPTAAAFAAAVAELEAPGCDEDDAAVAAAGIAPGQVRLSVGVEDPAELLLDLRQALDVVPNP